MNEALYGPAFFEHRSPTVTASAQAVVPHIEGLLAPDSVLDVGCGKGEWLGAFTALERHGVDIAPPDDGGVFFTQHDLTEPLDFECPKFDLVVCLEVAEHLPESAADTLIDTLCRHGDDIVFSAAVPGQEGKGHINCQPHEYWHAKFAARGYEVFDVIRPHIKNNQAVSPWYRNNMFLYMGEL